jgi:zinc protease
MKIVLLFSLCFSSSFAFGADLNNIKKFYWKDIPVVWLQDESFPTYTISVYFADGALSDNPSRFGETQMMLSGLDLGTNRYGQKEISDNLEYYGASYGGNVTHEYSTFEISGLAKDIVPTIKQICHLFKEATYPKKELAKIKKRMTSSLKGLVTDHGALASRVLRQVSLEKTPFSSLATGSIKSLSRIQSNHLKNKKDYFNEKVAKRIYISGPKEVLVAKDIFLEDCGWGQFKASFSREVVLKDNFNYLNPNIYLIPVPKANQAQIRIGRFFESKMLPDTDLMSLASGYIGGGFTSKLMQEVRAKRGLTYSIGAYGGAQKSYGRSGISTFTKNEKLEETLNTIKNVLDSAGKSIPQEELNKSVNHLAGGHLFRFEQNSAYLKNLQYFDHINKSYDDLINFPKKVRTYTTKEVAAEVDKVFSWNNQTIVVVGNKGLLKVLSKFGKVKVIDYKKFL